MAEESAFSDIEEIHEDILQYSPVHVCESDDPSDGWVTLHLDASARVEEIEPLHTRTIYSLQGSADRTMEVSQDYVSNLSSVAHLLASQLQPSCGQEITSPSELFIRSPPTSGSTESSVDYPHLFDKEGQKDEEITLVDQSLSSDFPEFEEIDDNFDINSLDSDETVDGSSQLYSGFPALLTGNFHTLTNPSSADFSHPSLNEASMKHSFSFQHHLDSMITFDENLNSNSFEIHGNHALDSVDMAGDCNNCSTDSIQNQNAFSDECNVYAKLQIEGKLEKSHQEEPITLPSESNKAANSRKRKDHGLLLENLPGGHVSSNKKFYCGQTAYEKQKPEAGTVRDLDPEGSSTERKEGRVASTDDNLRTISSTIAELNNTINLISAENISLRTKLTFFNQSAACSAKTGHISAGQPLGPLAIRHGTKVFSYKCISPIPIPGFILLQRSIRNNIKLKGCQVSAETFDTKRIAGVAAMGFCFIMMLCLPFNWRFSGSQNMKRGDILLWRGLKYPDMPINSRNFNLLDREIEQICLNSSTANYCIPGREPHDCHGMSGRDTIIGGIEQQKTTVEKKILKNLKGIQLTSLNFCHSNRCRSKNLSAPSGRTAFLPGIIKSLKSDGSLTVPKVNAGTRTTLQSAQQDQWKKGQDGQKSKQITLAVKTSRALQDLQSFKKTILKVSKGLGEHQRQNRNAFRFQKAFPTNGKVSATTKIITRLETSGFKQQQISQKFAGNMLGRGACTEMFRYKISPAPETHQGNVPTYCGKAKSNKRHCKSHACPLIKKSAFCSLPDTKHLLALQNIPESSYNAVGPAKNWSDKQSCQRPRPRSSIVVSVLAGSHVQQDKSSKNLDVPDVLQIFVVVLIDGVNYVAYSCILTEQGPKSQVVTD
ncbi:hypothetical protein O6H91_15G035700 [Diphasiastrum complanatum]|uniref:Uncharacterized protein n=15 Tax=Diphasiastrum complanatum TaxID=34168 RepID=A0ACC2BHB0_DIPCM|nr:hypothetical protein O6H91_15G035700 [Diphasiastrum complanatum]KAJ7529145.1 hypothetical protein O6H91_15G035700 [Diphasiastrum complanatum]KAJ7529146.1 hypothetical protein O6H91_15G035700 [Diphasiastrum complanatum]KAJ7529147.1 hypothetical protein O6H91_15G035700 [Diphasiastrum complanatum]KAJ7529148.1 hypothetical protein O6H91_15G035700 [Diphasiastrum complanatum]